MQTVSHRKPIKVLIGANVGHSTEVEMIAGLRDAGIDIHAALQPESPHFDRLKALGIPTRELTLKNNVDILQIRKIRRWIKKESFDILHGLANRPIANFISASYGLPVRMIAYRGATGNVSRWDPGCYLKWLNPRVDRIVCVSDAVYKDLVASGVDAQKLITIYKGHNLEWYSDSAKPLSVGELRDRRADLGIPPGVFLIGLVANMRRVKGADLLLLALKDLPPHFHALLVGEVRDPAIAEILKEPALIGRVHLTGHRKDATALVALCDVNTAPSRGREGLTKTVIEGMAQGVPAVVSKAGGLPEIVDDGINGFVVDIRPEVRDDIRDTHVLKHALLSIEADAELRQAMSTSARAKIANQFNIKDTIQKTKVMYETLIED